MLNLTSHWLDAAGSSYILKLCGHVGIGFLHIHYRFGYIGFFGVVQNSLLLVVNERYLYR